MKYPEEWSIVPIPKNCKWPSQLKDWQKIRIDRGELRKWDGNFGLVCGHMSDGLLAIDWDFRHGRKISGFKVVYGEYKKAFPELLPTLVCDTPHGYHFYYRIEGHKYPSKIQHNGKYSSTLKKIFVQNKVRFGKHLAGLDTRATAGQAVIPPSIVNGVKYKWMDDTIKPMDISKEQYERVMDWFEEKEVEKHTMRQGFVDILEGKIDPNKVATQELLEVVYWKETYHEACSCWGVVPEDLYAGLAKHNKGFDLEKTKIQIANKKNIDYIMNGKRLGTTKYNKYFPQHVKPETPREDDDIFNDTPKPTEDAIFLQGLGNIYGNDTGIYLEKVFKKNIQTYHVLNVDLKIDKISYDHLNNNQLLLTGRHNNTFRTFPFDNLMHQLGKYIYHGNMGKDAVKFYIHHLVANAKQTKLSRILGFNSSWNLPMLEDKKDTQIIVNTDMQNEAYKNAKKIYVKYSDKQKKTIKDLLVKFIDNTDMNPIKLSIIIGWSMAAPFREVFIKNFNIFPILCAYGPRKTGKSSVIEFFSITFYGIHDSHLSSMVLNSPSQLEDKLSSSSYPIFIEEVNYIDPKVLGVLKEHATGSTAFTRKKNSRELEFNSLRSAGIAIDCNYILKSLMDPATNTKLTLLPFTEDEIIESNYMWIELRNKLSKYKLFSLMYDYTKDWTEQDIGTRVSNYLKEIIEELGPRRKDVEKSNPRLIDQYIIISFGIELFKDIFGIEFDRKETLQLLYRGRTVMTRSILNDFHSFCSEAMLYDSEALKNPKYLSGKLNTYKSRKFSAEGYFFTTINKYDFQNLTREKFSFEQLVEQLKDALQHKHKNLIQNLNTGKQRGIFINEKFFNVNIFEKEIGK